MSEAISKTEAAGEVQNSFFDDLTPAPAQGSFWGRLVTFPSWEETKSSCYNLLVWMLEEAGRFGEVDDGSSIISGEAQMLEDVFTGVVGDKEINSKVRFTAINGIQNDKEYTIRLWEDISKLFATRIHFVYNETKGSLSVDGTSAFWDKYVRENPKTVRALANHWERLLEEMGGDGYIYHVAHSHGALLTSQAADMVSAEVRSRLIVRTFGAFQNPHQKDFADKKNIVCPDDPVVRWLNWYDDQGDVIRVKGVPNPKTVNDNHGLRGVPYWSYLRDHESFNFREKYASTGSKFVSWIRSFWDNPDSNVSEEV